MSACHRKLARLPLEVFEDLQTTNPAEQTLTLAAELRATICERLKRFRIRSRNGGTQSMSIKTVGDLLCTPRFVLLQAMDPLLTFGAFLSVHGRYGVWCCIPVMNVK